MATTSALRTSTCSVVSGRTSFARQTRVILFVLAVTGLIANTSNAIDISAAHQLGLVGNDPKYPLSGVYRQTATFSVGTMNPIGYDAVSKTTSAFTGQYTSVGGAKIQNLTIVAPPDSPDYVGLFGKADNAKIEGVILENISVTGAKRVGGLVGSSVNCDIDDCKVMGDSNVTGSVGVGGLIGHCEATTVDGCFSESDTHASTRWSGSMIGHIHVGSVVKNCHAEGDATGALSVGGFSGNIHGSTVEDCTAKGNADGGQVVGGFTGWMNKDLDSAPRRETVARNCRAYGSVKCNTHFTIPRFWDAQDRQISAHLSAGGFAAYLEDRSELHGCWASGSVECPEDDMSSVFEKGRSQTACGGLIGWATTNCKVFDCVAFGSIVRGHASGGLCGWAQDETEFKRCYAFGNLQDVLWESGGFLGSAERCQLEDCHATGDLLLVRGIPGNDHTQNKSHEMAAAGGLVGYVFPSNARRNHTVIEDCSAHGDINARGEMVGGLVGFCWGARIERCYATGNVTSDDRKLGGLVGSCATGLSTRNFDFQATQIIDSYARGNVTQLPNSLGLPNSVGLLGGLAGQMEEKLVAIQDPSDDGFITRCYSTGTISGPASPNDDVRGLVGGDELLAGNSIDDCYYDRDTVGYQTLNTSNRANDDTLGMPTTVMKQSFFFPTWLAAPTPWQFIGFNYATLK